MPDQRRAPGRADTDLRAYLQILWRRKWIVAVVAVVGLGGALGYSLSAAKAYTASADVLLQSSSSASVLDPAAAASATPADVATQVQLVTSAPVQAAAARLLGLSKAPRVSVSEVGTTDVIQISATQASARRAAAVANAYAKAFVDYTRSSVLITLTATEHQIQAKIAQLQKSIDTLGPSHAPQASALLAEQTSLQTQLSQLQVSAAGTTGGTAQVMTPALSSAASSSPKPVRDGALGAVVGLALGLGLALLRDQLDDSIRAREDLSEAIPGLPVLGVVPTAPGGGGKPDVAVLSSPKSAATEAYRSLKTSLAFTSMALSDRHLASSRCLAVTSPGAAEGKTTTLANLAVTMAEAGKSVAVVGADLRRPRLAAMFGLDDRVGLTSVVTREVSLEDALQRAPMVPNLTVLAAGPVPPNPAELLGAKATGLILEQLVRRFDVVLVDTAPVLPVADALIVSRWADSVIVVVNAGQTTRRQLERALELLGQVNATVDGTVLNGVAATSRYDGYYGNRSDAAYRSDAVVKPGRPAPRPEPVAPIPTPAVPGAPSV